MTETIDDFLDSLLYLQVPAVQLSLEGIMDAAGTERRSLECHRFPERCESTTTKWMREMMAKTGMGRGSSCVGRAIWWDKQLDQDTGPFPGSQREANKSLSLRRELRFLIRRGGSMKNGKAIRLCRFVWRNRACRPPPPT